MPYSNSCRSKISHHVIARQSKPFIDHSMQLQLPGCDTENSWINNSAYHPIYLHYVTTHSLSEAWQINESELSMVMHEAEQSHEAWQQMHNQLQQTLKQHLLEFHGVHLEITK